MVALGFTKLDEGIVHSSVWSEALATRVLWVTMLAMADSQGFVSSSRSGLFRAANIPQSDFDVSLEILGSPDPDSRSPEYDGRRIEKCDGGWTVLNYKRYREFTYSGSKEAIKKRKQRDKRGQKGDMSPKGGDISASASSYSYSYIKGKSEEKGNAVAATAKREATLDSDSDNEDESLIISSVLSYLNEKASTKFSIKADTNRKHISARIGEGRTLDDFKKVIDIKVSKWKGRTWPDTRKGREGQTASGDDYLRPSTLFRPENFENYLNESASPAKDSCASPKQDHDAAYWTKVRAKHTAGKKGDE